MQSNMNFTWLIIDDGSIDNTYSTVKKMIAESNFEIQYYKKSNGGKHTALNYSYQFIKTPLTMICDSDDWLTSNAIEVIENKYSLYKDEKDLCGFSFLKGNPNGGYLSSKKIPIDGMKASFCACRINKNIKGDMAEVWYTHCLEEYPFPKFNDEKFLGEDIVWIKMSEKYKLRFFNDVIYLGEYLEGGLTKNRRVYNIQSPVGAMERAKVFLDAQINFRYKIKPIVQYIVYGNFAGINVRKQYAKSSNKMLYFLAFLPSNLLFVIWKGKYNESKKNVKSHS